MPRQGEEFQKLVAYLERAVADQPNVIVESPKFIPDKVTGDPREHDIVITQRFPQREITTAIECRDHKRPVSVAQVEAFHTKCEDTGVNKRVIVSSSGFYKTTRTKAERYGIDRLTFAQVEAVDWLGQTEMTFRRREPRHTDIKVGAPYSMQGKNGRLFLSIIDGPDEDTGLRLVAGEEPPIVIESRPDRLMNRLMKQVPDPTSDLAGVWGIDIGNPEDFYFLDDDGVQHPLKALHLDVFWEATETPSPLTFRHYGAEDGQPAFETATTAVESLGDKRGRAMFIADADRRLRVLLALEPEEKKPGPRRASPASGTGRTPRPAR
jgi:hypothetical protein